MVPYWYHMVPYGTIWYHKVIIKTVKTYFFTKKIIKTNGQKIVFPSNKSLNKLSKSSFFPSN